MKLEFQQVKAIAVKNLKIKLRSYQTFLYSFGFPILFTFIFYFVFQSIEIPGGFNVFDLAFSSVLIYAASFGTISAAISLTSEKQRKTLWRLDTTIVGRGKIFLGTLLSEAVFLFIQLIIMLILGYGVFKVKWYNQDVLLLSIGLLILFIFGLSTLGIGIIISAYARTADAATGLSMCYVMPILFMSGILIPFENPIVYLCPPFWANQIYQQIVIMGNSFSDNIRVNSTNIFEAGITNLPIWSGIFLIILIALVTTYGGIKFFQRKTIA